MIFGVVWVIQKLSSILFYVALIVSPFLYTYLKSTCPAQQTFDSKEKLKIVLQGLHLADDDPRKPKSTLEKLISSTKASVTSEYASLTRSTQTQFTPLVGGICIVATVTIPNSTDPTKKDTHYWIGIRHQWHYIQQLSSSTSVGGTPSTTVPASSTLNQSLTDSLTSSASSSAAAAAAAAIASLTGSMTKDK
jgi:hypothetical protein